MNRRNWLAAIVAVVTGVLWRKKPTPPTPDWTAELLNGLFGVLCERYQNELRCRELCIEEARTPQVFDNKRRNLAEESCTLDGKGIQAREFYRAMVATIPDFHRRYQEFKDSRNPEIKRRERLYEAKVNEQFEELMSKSRILTLSGPRKLT